MTVTGARSVAKRAESLPHTYGPSRPSGASLSPRSRIGLELLAEDGSVLAGGEATAELHPPATPRSM